MLRLLIAVLVFAYVILPAASAQTTDSGYPDELSPSLAVAKPGRPSFSKA